MTDLNIERLKDLARMYTAPSAHLSGEDFDSPSCGWCAVLTLIERQEVLARELDRACRQHEDAASRRMDAEGLLDSLVEDAYLEGYNDRVAERPESFVLSEAKEQLDRIIEENKPMNKRDGGQARLDPKAISLLKWLREIGYTPEQVVDGIRYLEKIRDEAHEREGVE